MRYILIIAFTLIALSGFSQISRVDSTVLHQSRAIYNNAGYLIGSDSFHTKRVTLVTCGDTFYSDTDTLIQRRPRVFITIDSVDAVSGVPLAQMNDSLALYLKRAVNDTIFGYLYMRDKDGSPFDTQPGIYLESATGSYILTMDAGNGVLIANLSNGSQVTAESDKILISRDGYSPTDAMDVLTNAEIKGLISDSISVIDAFVTLSGDNTIKNGTKTLQNAQIMVGTGTSKTRLDSVYVVTSNYGDGIYWQGINSYGLFAHDSINDRYNDIYSNSIEMTDATKASTLKADRLTIARGGYSPGNSDVLRKDEINALISDSIATVSTPDLSDYVRKSVADTITATKMIIDGTDKVTLSAGNISAQNGFGYAGEFGASAFYLYSPVADEENTMSATGITMNNGAKSINIQADRVTIQDRDGYTPGATDVLTQAETKQLISDSISTTIGQVNVTGYLTGGGSSGAISIGVDTTGTIGLATKYDVATGAGSTNLSASGSGTKFQINSSTGTDVGIQSGTNMTITRTADSLSIATTALAKEQVLDTVANFIRLSQEFTKTDADAGDSLYIELKLRDVSRIAWTTASHKWINMPSNATTGGTLLGGVWAVSGTNTAPTKATTTLHEFMNRAEILRTSTASTNICMLYSTSLTHGFGNAAGMGGFYFVGTFGPTIGMSNTSNRGFWGMRNGTGASADVEPSTFTNAFGIAWDSADGNVQFIHNDGSGNATKVDLGSNFAVATADRTEIYRLFMYAEPNGSTVYYKVVNLKTGNVAVGSVNTNLPSNTTMFTPTAYHTVGGVSGTCGVSVFQLEIFSDF